MIMAKLYRKCSKCGKIGYGGDFIYKFFFFKKHKKCGRWSLL